MARMLALLGAVSVLLGMGASSAHAEAGDVLVRFAKSAGAGERAAARDDADTRLERVLQLRGVQLVDPKAGVSVSEAVHSLEASPDVVYAEPDRLRRASLVTPNDPYFTRLWGLNNTGQPGTPDADIDAAEAWDVTQGTPSVTVAVVDTGVDGTHPDLAENMVAGWDFVDSDSDPADENGHGTHVAGTIGARGDNGVGVPGVAWKARIMPVRVLGADGSGWDSDVADGYTWASEHGARVVNASLGSPYASQTECEAIKGAPKTLFVVAAGNDSSNNDTEGSLPCSDSGDGDPDTGSFPCNYAQANVVCVAATNRNDVMAGFSNYGASTVDLAAPGVGTFSTWAASFCGEPEAEPATAPCWATLSGTSMATPHVAGVAALVWSVNSALSVATVRQALLSSVDSKAALAGTSVTGGRLNAFKAVTAAGGLPSGSGGGSEGPAGGTSTAPAAPAPITTQPLATLDRIAPALRLAFRRQTVRSVLRRGFRLKVRKSEPAGLRAELFVQRGIGKKVRTARVMLVGRKRLRTSRASTVTLRVRLTRKARRTLRGLHRVRVRLRVRAVDRSGNARVVTRRLLLR